MLKDFVKKEFIRAKVEANNWEDAIHQGVLPLYHAGSVSENYECAIVENLKKMGAYMVISPGIVLSHAAPEDGVNRAGIGVINLKHPISFGHPLNDPVFLVITLAFSDKRQAKVVTELMKILMDDYAREVLMHSSSKEEMEKILNDGRLL